MSSQSALWRDRDFVRLWLAQSVSAFGSRITREGLPIAAILTLGATAPQVGLLSALSYGPALVVGLAAGGFVDRSKRRGLMMGADLLRAVILASLPIAALLHMLSLPHLYVAAALVGAASVLFEIADHAYLPSLVGRNDLVTANSSLSTTESVAEIAGPALAGTLFQILAAPIAIALNAVTYLVSALFLAGIRKAEPTPEPEPHARWTDDVALGFTAAWRHPLVRPILLMTSAQSLAGGIFGATYMLFCLKVVGLGPALLGVAIAMGGVGALAGSVLAGWLSRRFGVGPSILGAQALFGVVGLLIAVTPAEPKSGLAFLMVSQFLGDAVAVAGMILGGSLRQTVLPTEVLGRVGATFKAAGGGFAIVGALAGGVLGEALGIRGAIIVAAVGLGLCPLFGLPSPLRRLREMPEPVA
jgi:MFS family permease